MRTKKQTSILFKDGEPTELAKNLITELYQYLQKYKCRYDYDDLTYDGRTHINIITSYYGLEYCVSHKNTGRTYTGNMYYILSNIDRLFENDVEHNFIYDTKSVYGMVERYAVIKQIVKIDDLIVYDLKQIFTDLINHQSKTVIELGGKKMELSNELIETFKHLYCFKKFFCKYFNIINHRINCIYYMYCVCEDNLDLQYINGTKYVKPKSHTHIKFMLKRCLKSKYNNQFIKIYKTG